MSRAGLIIIAALGLSAAAAPSVFATAPAGEPVMGQSLMPSAQVTDGLTAALDDWCSGQDDRTCTAWRAESGRVHALQSVDTRGDLHLARVALRQTSMRLHIQARQTSTGWGIEAVRGERTVRCGTPAFDTVRSVVRSASPAWAARVDGCSPDALRPIEVERAALRPVLVQGEQTIALVEGPELLALAWRAGAWQVR